jgi:zinc protease
MGRRSIVGAFAVLVAATTVVVGQQPPVAPGAPPTSGVVRKNKAPVSDETLRVRLPRPTEADLPNGLHLMVLEDRRVPQVTFTLLVHGAGGYADPASRPGLASVAAAMMREGTTTRSSAQISEQLETMAANLNVSASASSLDAVISGSSLTEHLERVMDLAADVVLNPSFPDDELARYKLRTRAQLLQQRSQPAFLANERYARVLYGDHPAGRVSMTVEALDATTKADLVALHKTRYIPNHAVLAIAGDVSFADAKTLVESRFGRWAKTGDPAPPVADPVPAGPGGISFVARPSSVQTSFIVGTQAIKRADPDYDVVSVMNRVIGGGPTARLFLQLREEKGYTYGAYSSLLANHFRGDWRAQTDVRAEVTEPALRDLLVEVARLRDEPVSDGELRDVKRSMVASFALSLESPAQVLSSYVTSWQYNLPADYWDRFPDRIMAVTSAQVRAAAQKYLEAGRLQIVAVANPESAAVLRKYGSVTTYDTEGRRTADAN